MLSAVATLPLFAVPVSAEIFILPPGDGVVGVFGTVAATYEDTLTDIARRFGVGYEEIVRANPGVDPWLPGEGTSITLPTQFILPRASRSGLIVNIAEYRMYYFGRDGDHATVATFPISIGRMDWSTPLGRSAIVSKAKRPTWYPPRSVREEYEAEGRTLARSVPPGPDNPLGEYAMRLSIPGYLIHGTNRPAGVGMRVTHGCIRMYPEDIEWLFPQTAVPTAVQLVNQPYKLDWLGDGLFLEVHPPLQGDEEHAARGLTAITELYVRATRSRAAQVDWGLIDEVFRRRDGIPVRVGSRVLEAAADAQARLDGPGGEVDASLDGP